MSRYWYGYIAPGNVFDEASYRLLPDQDLSSSCFSGAQICAIYATAGGINPVLSTNLQNYITSASSSSLPQPEEPANTKKYLYKRAAV